MKDLLSTISCRLDPDLKTSWFLLCEQLGLTPSCCINLLAKQMVRDRCLPFVPSLSKKGKEEWTELYESASGGDY